MLNKLLVVIVTALLSIATMANDKIVQGPFKLTENDSIVLKKENDEDFPLALYLQSEDKMEKVDRYEVNGANPIIETVFFTKVNGIKNIIVLVSWHQLHQAEKILGYLYQIYGYEYLDGTVIKNKNIIEDPEMSGIDGEFNGDEVHFKYKDAASIRAYLNRKFK